MDSPYVIFNATRIDHLTLKNLDDYLQAYPQKTIVINFHNSVPLTKDNLALLPQNNPRVNIRIAGQYDSEYINNHQFLYL